MTTVQPAPPAGLQRLARILLARDPDPRVQAAREVLLRLREIAEEGVNRELPWRPRRGAALSLRRFDGAA
jgi:hypothetical protein